MFRDNDEWDESYSLEEILKEASEYSDKSPVEQSGRSEPKSPLKMPEDGRREAPPGDSGQPARQMLWGGRKSAEQDDRHERVHRSQAQGTLDDAGPKKSRKRRREARDWTTDTVPFPVQSASLQIDPPPGKGKKSGVITAFPPGGSAGAGKPVSQGSAANKPPKKAPPVLEPEEPEKEKVLEFPSQRPVGRVAAGLDRLRRRADDFADHMYEEEDRENDEETRQAERLIPGVDEEENESPPSSRRRRFQFPPARDIPPAELGKRYERDLKSRRFRCTLLFPLFLICLYLSFASYWPLPIPDVLGSNTPEKCWMLAVLHGLALFLSLDTILLGLIRPFQLRTGMDTLIVVANLAVFLDAITLPRLLEEGVSRQPYCAVSILGLLLTMGGELEKRRGQRMACRTAASSSRPYRVTRDESAWNGRDTYAKSSGVPVGFGSQIQGADGAERIFRVFVPLMLLACFVFSMISSLGQKRPENLFWCLAATLTASASLSATLCFGPPWRKLCTRLAKSGAALAGWQGITNTTGTVNLLLYDADLFPPGSVTLHSMNFFDNFRSTEVISNTATVIRDSGSGLKKLFRDVLHAQGGLYRRGENFEMLEGGGFSEIIRGQYVLVGPADFMTLMDISIPPGLNINNAVFCAIDGRLAGIFALSYHLPSAVPPALDSLIRNHITPVLATRDFNLIPSMLYSRFKLPADRMEFPSMERRWDLSDPNREHSETLTAILCREGISPYAEVVVGGRRLRSAVQLSAILACVGSIVGGLLAFYLTFLAAYASLTLPNLLVFLLMWLVPTYLIGSWVDRY